MSAHRTVIGLTGRAGAGKDTAARMLEELLIAQQGNVLTTSFAMPLREMLAPLLRAAGAQPTALVDRAAKEQPLPLIGASPRRLLQSLGTDWGRNLISPTLWIDLARRRITRHPGLPAIITDIRFADEAEFIVGELAGEVWQIVRDVEPVAAHASEAGLPAALITRRIDNTGSLDALRNRLTDALAAERANP